MRLISVVRRVAVSRAGVEGEAGSRVTVVSLPGRRAGLEDVQAVSQRTQHVVTGLCWSRPVASSDCLVPGPGYPSGGGGRLGRNEPRQSRP
jgi:hypothetical protein